MIVINNPTAEKILGQFFSITTALHQAHLTTGSYAEHNAYGYGYDAMLGFQDEVMEKIFGYSPAAKSQVKITTVVLASKETLPTTIESLSKTIKSFSNGKYSDLDNLADSISGAASKLAYLLTLK